MTFDEVRNKAYSRALAEWVTPQSTILDLGAGLGIHGLMAARLGAQKVYLVDHSPVVKHVAEIARANDLGDRVEVIQGRIEEVELPERVDLIVSVFTGNFLLTEDLLPLLFFARDRFLKPDGKLIPGKARMRVALVRAEKFYAERISCWSERAFGIDYDPIRKFAANTVHYGYADDVESEFLSEPATLAEFDFSKAGSAECKSSVEIAVTGSGICHGLLGWFDIQVGDQWISTGPQAERMHWRQAFLPLDPAPVVDSGGMVSFKLDRPEFGEWTWTVKHNGGRQRRSTFHSQLADLKFLKSQAESFIPGVSQDGELALFVLEQMSSGLSTGEILNAARSRFADGYSMRGHLDRKVRHLISSWKNQPR